MAKGKTQKIGMTAEINSIPTCAIQTNVQYEEEAYLNPIVWFHSTVEHFDPKLYTWKKFSTKKWCKYIVIVYKMS